MCGINGILAFDRAHLFHQEIIRMTTVLSHRGPDGEGFYDDPDIRLGHRRLAIIDLSSTGRQPMSNANGSLWVVLNGEIYNYKVLKSSLEAKNYQFKSTSDTEVLLHGFDEWGTDLFQKLEGMFAFALWSKNDKELFLVRDSCGIKPMFYCSKNGQTVFSSEIKGLLASHLIDREINLQALSNFLSLFYVPGPETIFKSISQVPPGTFIRFSKNAQPEAHEYWNALQENRTPLTYTSPDQFYEHVREEVSIAVRGSLVSDVPVSLLLSSGLDSSLILHELKRLGETGIQTVTMGFDEPSYDESPLAKRFASDLGMPNLTETMPKSDIPSIMENMIYHLDALNANPCILAEYYYFKKIAEKYKVTLMGSGNDELFAGYPTYIADQTRKYYGMLPMFIRRFGFAISKRFPVNHQQYSFDYLAQKFTEGSLFNREKSHYWWRTIFSDHEKEELFKENLINSGQMNLDAFSSYEKYFHRSKGALPFEDQTLYADFYHFLIDNANMEVDQLSMAFSLEARPPFLTKRFVEFAFNIPFNMKLRNYRTKHCLREGYKNILPRYILEKKKQGLVSPLSFLFQKTNANFLQGHLFSYRMAELFNLNYIQKLLDDHQSARKNNSYKLFSLLSLSIWLKLFANTKDPVSLS